MDLNILALDMNAFKISWGLCLTVGLTALLYYCFQKLDFSKLFKANSTFQIKTIILFISLAISIICSIGFCMLLDVVINFF